MPTSGTFQSSASTHLFDNVATQSVTITRRTIAGTQNVTNTAIYNGPADVQLNTGTEDFDPLGPVDTADGTCFISPSSGGALPAVLYDDILIFNGEAFRIQFIAPWSSLLPHLELSLKRGSASLATGYPK